MKAKSQLFKRFSAVSLFSVFASQQVLAQGGMDSVNTNIDTLDSSVPIHVHTFSTVETDLGNPKFKDTAQAMAKSAPHLLAVDIVHALREAGFSAVTLDESDSRATDSLNLTGRFTRLDPGSRNLRIWVGLGAGESKVCISGELTNSAGEKLANFADCRNGLGWGESGPQIETGAEVLGQRIAGLLIDLSRQ